MILSAVPSDNSSDFEDSTFLSLLVSINPFWVLIEKQINHFPREAKDWDSRTMRSCIWEEGKEKTEMSEGCRDKDRERVQSRCPTLLDTDL